jgi:hypothetical protein
MILRATICFKDIGLFTSSSLANKSSIYGENYTGNHIAIFECHMKAPPQMSFVDHNLGQYHEAYRINFKNWKIVDIDNFMEGNPFFSSFKEESVW